MRTLTASEKQALFEVAADLKVEPRTLAAEIEFESHWNPQARNPRSSASGLIQFMDDTAYRMGYMPTAAERKAWGIAADAHPRRGCARKLIETFPDVESQLRGPVRGYLARMKPYPTDQSLFMAVFYPAARTWPPERAFPANVQEANPGIRTVRDYLDHVWSRVGAVNL